MRTQVHRNHYNLSYLSPEKFQLYFHIVKTVMELEPSAVLEIGVGTKLVTHMLRFNGVNVTCSDFDASLQPDVVCDVRNLCFEPGLFDVVLASQILEHIPFDDVPQALKGMLGITNKYVVISVPYNRHNLTINLNLKVNKYLRFRGFFNRLIDKFGNFYINLGIDQSAKNFAFNGEHHWEIGYKEFPIGRVRDVFCADASIIKEFRVPHAPYHYVFVLKKQKPSIAGR